MTAVPSPGPASSLSYQDCSPLLWSYKGYSGQTFFCWTALMAHSMFCTDYVATVVYGGSAYAERGSIEDIRFDEGVRMGSVGLLLHSTTACLFSSFVQDSMANLVGNKVLYISGLALFGFSMLFTVIFPSA